MTIQAQNGTPLFLTAQRFTDESLRLGTTSYMDRLVNAEFIGCTLEIQDPNAVLLSRCRFIDCVIRPSKKVSTRIGDNYWDGCVFHGHYEGTHFGLSDDQMFGPSSWTDVALRGCDFSTATLAGCCLNRLEIESTKFPKWPCFTVLQPFENLPEWSAATAQLLPKLFEYITDDGRDAEAHHWPSLVNWYKLNTAPDPELVRVALSQLDFVRL